VKTDHDDIYDMVPGAIAQQSDGKLLVAGSYTTRTYNVNRVLLRRYNTNGSVDLSFGLSGFGVAQIYPSIVEIYGTGRCLLVQRDGRIVIGGHDYWGNAAAWRFTTYGELDTTFDSDGTVMLQSGPSEANAVVNSQGKSLFGIHRYYPDPSILKRLNGNGSIDTTFGNGGSTEIINSNQPTVAVNPSNSKLIVAGSENNTPALQHLNSNGTYDTAYGIDGVVSVPLSTSCGTYTMTLHWLSSLAIQSDGNMIVGGAVQTIGGCTLASCYGNGVARLRANDTLDTSYGINGFAVRCDGRVGDPKIKLTSSISNQILVNLGTPISGSSDKFRRYTSGGFQNLVFTGETPADFLVQSGDGKIVTVSGYGDLRLARYQP
jgi:uncharacterized delta-60 repeat protein